MKNNNNNKKRYNNNNNNNKRKYVKRHKIYKYTIRTAIVNFVTPDYTEKNLRFDIYDLLRSTQVFSYLEKQYLQYKLLQVTFIATPRTVSGTDPAPIWIYLDTSMNNNFNYSAMEELQGSKTLPVKHKSFTTFTASGRQNDFNYWYDVQTQASDLIIRLHSEATPDSNKYWQFQIRFSVAFRGFIVSTNNNRMEKGIKQEKESTNNEQGLVIPEKVEFEETLDSNYI